MSANLPTPTPTPDPNKTIRPPRGPYLGSERNFRLYETYLSDIVGNWPRATIFTPKPPVNSVETLASRIRIARDSLRKNQWTTHINTAKFKEMCDEIVCSTLVNPGKVTCGPEDVVRRSGVKQLSHQPDSQVDTSSDQPLNLDSIQLNNPSEEVIKAILTLHAAQILIEPSIITTPLPLQLMVAQGADVSVIKDGDKYTIL